MFLPDSLNLIFKKRASGIEDNCKKLAGKIKKKMNGSCAQVQSNTLPCRLEAFGSCLSVKTLVQYLFLWLKYHHNVAVRFFEMVLISYSIR